jgi:SAM-dependent methyltransferase
MNFRLARRLSKSQELARQTIADFGTQWTTYSDTAGLFGSAELLADFIAPFPLERFYGARVADIGAGTGRHSRALLEAGAARVVAVEPSQAVDVIRSQLASVCPGRIEIMNCSGDLLPASGDLDYAISIGVLHHIPEPAPVVAAVYRALRPGGQFVAWLYGQEGNTAYLWLMALIRPLSKRMPPRLTAILAWFLDLPLVAYMTLCRWLPHAGLPLTDYLNNVLGRLPGNKRRLVIYDQLKPRYAKYYTRAEAVALMSAAPFTIEVHPRRGFSWVVIGTKPLEH